MQETKITKTNKGDINEGINLQHLRLDEGWNQTIVSEKSGVSQRDISSMENQKKIKNIANLEKIAAIYGLTAKDIQTRDFSTYKERDNITVDKVEAHDNGQAAGKITNYYPTEMMDKLWIELKTIGGQYVQQVKLNGALEERNKYLQAQLEVALRRP